MRLKWRKIYARRPDSSVPLGKQKNTKTCVRTTGTSQKVTIFDPKIRHEIKKVCRLSAVHHVVRQPYT